MGFIETAITTLNGIICLLLDMYFSIRMMFPQ